LLRWIEVDGNRGRRWCLPDSGRAGDRLERGAHGGDVRRGGAAAAPDVGHAEIRGLAGVGREVLGRREVEEAPFDARRKSGIGLAGERQPGLVPHRLENLERHLRTDPAIDPDDVDAGTLERLHHLARFLRAEGEAIFGEGHLGDDRQVGRFLRRADRREQLGEIGEGLQHEEIGAAFEQGRDLFLEGGRRLGDRNAADGLELLADGPDRPGEEDRLAGDLARLARQFHRPEVDVAHAPFEAVAGELDPVGAEGIGLDQLRASRNVRSVNFLDDFGLGEVEFVEGSLEADAAGVELGAHGAVAQERAAAQPLEERMEAGLLALGGRAHGAQ